MSEIRVFTLLALAALIGCVGGLLLTFPLAKTGELIIYKKQDRLSFQCWEE